MKKVVTTAFLLFSLFLSYRFVATGNSTTKKEKTENDVVMRRLKTQIDSIQTFIIQNPKYNSRIGFFIDMRIMSGKNRFFVFDFEQNKIIDQGLVAHGSGSETGIEGKLKFSNLPNSNSSSLGKYSIENYYNGRFGKAYKLYGLDPSNNNALERFIVLHKYSKVPYDEQLSPICNSLGCPMVNEKFYNRLEKIIDNSPSKILLKIYY